VDNNIQTNKKKAKSFHVIYVLKIIIIIIKFVFRMLANSIGVLQANTKIHNKHRETKIK
jgi:hypothetical protein